MEPLYGRDFCEVCGEQRARFRHPDEESERRWQEELYSQLKEDQRQRQMQMEEDWFREEAPFLEEELLRAEYEDLLREEYEYFESLRQEHKRASNEG